MKLHRIAVTNLNSLYGEQQIDLDAGLGGASLFLIQGPTGSGKSTLMDAVSLALFATTPRFTKRQPGESAVKEVALAEQVMSRGEGVAQAELEFSKWEAESGRRVRYRAVWSARRARNKPGGKMQATSRSLERMKADGTWEQRVSDHRRKVVKPFFEEVLEGFTMADFERSMLLAQGRFDAMLHALPEERAAILERLTDTAIYQKLGERAARMRGAWKGRLEGLKARIEAISPVSAEALEQAEAAVAREGALMERHEAALADANARRGWLLRGAELRDEGERLQSENGELLAEEEAARSKLEALAEHERCVDAFALLDRVSEAEQRLTDTQTQHDALVAALPQLAEAAAQAVEAERQAESQWKESTGALEALRGPAAQAREAATELKTALAERESAAQGVQRAEADVAKARARRLKAEGLLAEAEGLLAEAVGALSAVEADAVLEERQGEIREEHASLVQEERRLDRDRNKHGEREVGLEGRRQAHRRATDAHEALWKERISPVEAALRAAAAEWHALCGEREAVPVLEELREERMLSITRRGGLELAVAAVTGAEERRGRLDAREAVFQRCEATVSRSQPGLHACVEGVERAEAVVVERERALGPLEQVATLSARRKDLADGSRCPLCGSVEHPYVDDPEQRAEADRIDELVEQSRSRLEAAKAELQRRLAAREAADRALAAAQAERAAAERERDAAREELTEAVQGARGALERAGLGSAAGLDALKAELESVGSRIESLGVEIEQVEAARTRHESAVDRLEQERRAQAEAQAKLSEERTRIEVEGAELERLEREIREAAEAVERRRSQLNEQLLAVGVQGESIEAGVAELRARVEVYQAAAKGQAEAEHQLHRAREKCESTAQALDEAVERAGQERAEAKVREAVAQQAETHRVTATSALQQVWFEATGEAGSTLLPAQMLRSQTERVGALEKRRIEAAAYRESAERARAESVARAETLDQSRVQLCSERDGLLAELDQCVSELGVDGVDAIKEYKLSNELLVEFRSLHSGLQQRRALVRARAQSHAERTETHKQRRPPTLSGADSADSLVAEIEAVIAARDACQGVLDEARATLKIAHRDREGRAAAESELAAARKEAEVWIQLHELIGVGDGKRFKMFAQALNLEQLLVQANHHLVHINDRYRLRPQRDPQTGLPTLEFVVEDQWRPGATRSLRTLSGGESFLVSLALALGLSDLRTSSMPVETLLLDEGFGTLDPETLDTALAALEQLQASGRQVGIISHVQGLQERIEARVLVEPVGEGRSQVRTVLGGHG